MDTAVTVLLAVAISVAVTAGVAYSIYSYDYVERQQSLLPLEPDVNDDTQPQPQPQPQPPQPHDPLDATNEIKKITSIQELKEIIGLSNAANFDDDDVFFSSKIAMSSVAPEMMVDDTMRATQSSFIEPTVYLDSDVISTKDVDYSGTNIQVKNVDEPDYIKNDAKYVYIVHENTLSIIDAYPAETSQLILKVALDIESQHIQNMFLNGDKLVIFYNHHIVEDFIPRYDFIPYQTFSPATNVMIIDVADKTDPQVLHNYYLDGYFRDARMIGNYTYFVTNKHVDYQTPQFPEIFKDSVKIATSEPFYFDNNEHYSEFTTITAIDIFGNITASKTFLLGYTGTFYVSQDNFYLTYRDNSLLGERKDVMQDRFFDVILPLLPQYLQDDILSIHIAPVSSNTTDNKNNNGNTTSAAINYNLKWQKISQIMQDAYVQMDPDDKKVLFDTIYDALDEYDVMINSDKTIIHKLSIDSGQIDYVAAGSVSGTLLNQFSMDQDGDRLRVATTTQYYTPGSGLVRANSVYILDYSMNVIGGVDEIAPDESIFSSRFIGDRLYLVTFRQVDPFFVIDLSGDVPKVLGELKIPGFSNYLHPFDDDHIIGVGRDTKLDEYGRVAQLGVKIALFNVTDVHNPTLADQVVIGDNLDTDSDALYDHKAFFFDKSRNVMIIPISTFTTLYQGYGTLGEFYVFDVDAMMGFDTRGVVEHDTSENYYYGARTFYIDDVLYTVFGNNIMMNNFDDLEEINSIEFAKTSQLITYLE